MDENKDAQTEFPSINDYIDSLPYGLENMEIKSDSPFLLPYKQSNDTSQCCIPLPHTAEICDRFGISDRAGAALATATLTDFGIITEENQLNVIGPSKLAAERNKYRQLLRERQHGNLQKITSLYFDGKRTATRVSTQNKITGKWSTSIKIQDHYVILDQPGSTSTKPKYFQNNCYTMYVI